MLHLILCHIWFIPLWSWASTGLLGFCSPSLRERVSLDVCASFDEAQTAPTRSTNYTQVRKPDVPTDKPTPPLIPPTPPHPTTTSTVRPVAPDFKPPQSECARRGLVSPFWGLQTTKRRRDQSSGDLYHRVPGSPVKKQRAKTVVPKQQVPLWWSSGVHRNPLFYPQQQPHKQNQLEMRTRKEKKR